MYMAQRTGYPILSSLWSYVTGEFLEASYVPRTFMECKLRTGSRRPDIPLGCLGSPPASRVFPTTNTRLLTHVQRLEVASIASIICHATRKEAIDVKESFPILNNCMGIITYTHNNPYNPNPSHPSSHPILHSPTQIPQPLLLQSVLPESNTNPLMQSSPTSSHFLPSEKGTSRETRKT
jgi:hypothetical protein